MAEEKPKRKPKAPKEEVATAEIHPVVTEITEEEIAETEIAGPENLPEKAENSLEQVENSLEEAGDLAEQPAAEPEEQEILSGPAELAKVNPNLPDDKSKWLARLVAEKGFHILFKGSFAKAYRVADNYNVTHGFPAGKIRRIYK